MDADALIRLFGQETGVPLVLGDNGTLALAFEAGPTVQVEHDADANVLHCYVVLGSFSTDPERRAALSLSMLQANAFCRGTGGATFGVDNGEIVLSRCLELGRADSDWLRTTVESIVMVANDWLVKSNSVPPETRGQARTFDMPDFNSRA